ncbi:unnamed protein product [Ectocarpus sp. 4 AP-2014]
MTVEILLWISLLCEACTNTSSLEAVSILCERASQHAARLKGRVQREKNHVWVIHAARSSRRHVRHAVQQCLCSCALNDRLHKKKRRPYNSPLPQIACLIQSGYYSEKNLRRVLASPNFPNCIAYLLH